MSLFLASKLSPNPVARLGDSHGYRFAGDVAHLNADILCDEYRLSGQNWALQLWTDEGIRIAELQLGLLQPNGTGRIQASGSTDALPPAGEGPHIISMVLVSGFGGALDTIEDCSTYPHPATFEQPRLRGTVCSGFTSDEIMFDIARIENPRPADNMSGMLALELWALDTPYTGGAWSGIPVASLIFGTLGGQCEWTNCRYATHSGPLPADGYLTLMLREWTPAGYLTRDYRSLARPTPARVRTEDERASAAKAGATPAAVPAEKKPAATKPSPAGKARAKTAAKARPAQASINKSSAAELDALKWISRAIAEGIVAARPYASIDDVVRAWGMGPKLLEKVRSSLIL